MSWIEAAKTALTVGALACSGAALAATIVVKASGPSARNFPPGKPVTGATITLKQGDTLVLLDGRGTRTITGPAVHSVSGSAAAATSGSSALGALLRSSGTRQVRTGAVRGTGTGPAKSPNLWYVDLAQPGVTCTNGAASLWRGDMTAPATVQITRLSDGRRASVDFAAGQSVRTLPVELGSEGRYRLTTTTGKPVDFVLKPVTVAGGEADAVAAKLIEQGCQRQLDLLVTAATPTG